MKNVTRLLLVFVILSLALAGCLNPVSVLTNTEPTPAGGRVRELPGPTTEPKPIGGHPTGWTARYVRFDPRSGDRSRSD